MTEKDKTTSINVRIVFIVLANSSCWLFIVILEICQMLGVLFNNSIYSYCVVILLPLNTLLNPLLNVYTTLEFKAIICPSLFKKKTH